MSIPPKRTRKSPKPFPQPQPNPPTAVSNGGVTKRAAKKPNLGPCTRATKGEVAADFEAMGLGLLFAATKTPHKPRKHRKRRSSSDGPRHAVEKTPDSSQSERNELDLVLENPALVQQEHIVPAQLPSHREHGLILRARERTPLSTELRRPGNKLVLVVSGIPLEILAA